MKPQETLFETLRADHDQQRRLFPIVLDSTLALADREAALAQLVQELEAHAAAEEQVFYATVLAADEMRSKSVHGIEEHQQQRDAMAELRDLKPGGEAWTAELEHLRHLVEHHLEEEEHTLFQMAGKVLGEAEKVDLAVEFNRIKSAKLA